MNSNDFNRACQFVCTNGKIHVFKYRVASSVNTFMATTGTLVDDKLTEGYVLTVVSGINEYGNNVIFPTIGQALKCAPPSCDYKWRKLDRYKFKPGTIIEIHGNYYLVIDTLDGLYQVIQLKSADEGYSNTLYTIKEDNTIIGNGRAVYKME